MGCSPHSLGLAWGKHPIDFPGHGFHSILVFMSAQKLMKAIFGKANRSGFHYFVTPVFLMHRQSEAGFDVLGGLIVVSLSLGVVFLMRLILA